MKKERKGQMKLLWTRQRTMLPMENGNLKPEMLSILIRHGL